MITNKIKGIIYVHIISLFVWANIVVYRDTHNHDPITHTLFPFKIKLPMIFENEPHKNHLDGWSMYHVIYNFVSGFIFPNQYYFILLISILTEMVEQLGHIGKEHVGGKGLDIITNMVAYHIGSLLSPN